MHHTYMHVYVHKYIYTYMTMQWSCDMPIRKTSAKISNMRLQKKAVEITVTTNYAETTSTEVKLRLKRVDFFVNYIKKTVR